jgi:hypothetical protein
MFRGIRVIRGKLLKNLFKKAQICRIALPSSLRNRAGENAIPC